MTSTVRPIHSDDIAPLVALWHAGWIEAHAAHVPEALTRLRTQASFKERLLCFGEDARTIGPIGAPIGFCAIDGAEIDQLYVSPEARGTGVAQTLLDDGVARIKAAGHETAFLYCEQKNAKAARFYERMGWTSTGVHDVALDTSEGPFTLPALIYEKSLS